MCSIPTRYDAEQVKRFSDTTIAYYDRFARAFWNGTRDHDVSQNYAAFVDAIEGEPPYSILDLGCGPGRDLLHFRSLGHEAVGLDGSGHFVAMARSHSQCDVFHQDFLAMQLPESRFDAIDDFVHKGRPHEGPPPPRRVLAANGLNYSASRPATDRGDHPLHPAFIAKNEAASAWMVEKQSTTATAA